MNFLQTCQSFNVIPKFLQFCVANKNLQRLKAYLKCLNHLLLAKINNNKNLKVFVNELSLVKSNLLGILNFLDFNHVCKLSNFIIGYEVNLTKFSHDFEEVIFNFSSYVLTEDKKVYFVKGLGFVYHLKRFGMLLSYAI